MANLNFKWGLHASLPSSIDETQVGSLFFTKDEGGLYLGVEKDKAPRRIQGVVQYYADLTEFKKTVVPPYSSDVIYYIASENALVKWTGESIGADGTINSGKFTILNVTASEFNDLSSVVVSQGADIGTLSTNLGSATAAAGDTTAFARIKQLENAVDALETLAGIGGGGSGASLSDRIGALEAWQTTASGTISGLEDDVKELGSDLTELTGTVATQGQQITNLDGKIGQNTNEISTIKGNINTINGTTADLNTRLTTAEGFIKTHTEELPGIKQDIQSNANNINELTTVVDGHGTRLTTAEEDIDKLEGLVNGHTSNISGLAERVTKNEQDIAGHGQTIAQHGKDITSLNGSVSELSTNLGSKNDGPNANGSAFGRIAALAAADEGLDDRIEALEADNATNKGNIATQGGKIATLEGQMKTAQGDIVTLQGDVALKANQADLNTLSEKVTENTRLIGVNADNIEDNAEAIEGLNNLIGTAPTGTKGSVYADMADLGSKVTTNESNIGSLTTKVTKLEEADAAQDLLIDKNKEVSEAADALSKENAGLIEGINTLIGTANSQDTNTAFGKINKNAADITTLTGNLNTSINNINTKFNDYQTVAAATEAHNALSAEITSQIKAANALTYKGELTTTIWGNITTTADTVKIGDTYIVAGELELNTSNLSVSSAAGITNNKLQCHAGDMLIATAASGKNEGANGYLAPADIHWVHVASGYYKEHEAVLSVDSDATIQLTSLGGTSTAGDLGEVQIASASSNVTVSVSNSTISIGLAWDEF